MPLASSRSSTSSKAASDRRRMSLPSTIDSSTRVTTRAQRAIDRRRSSLQRTNSGRNINSSINNSNSNSNINNKRPLETTEPPPPTAPLPPLTPPRSTATTRDKENTILSPGVTPYWKVAQERGDSPRLTRSASKQQNNRNTSNNNDDDDRNNNHHSNNNNKRIKRPPIANAAVAVTTAAAAKPGHEDHGSHGVILNFSPPDHHANALREKQEVERKLQERERRRREAKERGRLLIFSPPNGNHHHHHQQQQQQQQQHQQQQQQESATFETPSPPPPQYLEPQSSSSPPPQGNGCDEAEEQRLLSPSDSAVSTMTSQSQTVATSSSAASMVEATLNQHREQFASELKSLRHGMNQLLATREQAAAAVAAAVEEERRRADQLALEAQLVRTESLASANLQLEESNKTLQQRLQELQRNMDHAKESLVVERTRLEAEVQATQRESSVRIQGLEDSRQQLETQVATLQQQKTTLARQVSDLETEVKVAREKLDHAKTMLETMRSTSAAEKDTLQREVQRLTITNAQLTTELQTAMEARGVLESKLSEYEDDMDKLQNQLLPESEEQLQEALMKLQEQTQAATRAETQLQSYQAKIKQLQQEVAALRDGMEQERFNFQQLNEDSAVAFDKMTKQSTMKDDKIHELVERMETLQKELEVERRTCQECNDEFGKWKQEMEKRTTELDQALSETMSLLEFVEGKEKDAVHKLEETTSRLQVEVHAKEQAQASCHHSEVAVSRLEEACQRLEAEAREQKRRAKELERQLEDAVKERDFARERVEHHDIREDELFRKLMDNERLRRDLHNRVMQLSGNIRVFVRVRPPIASEMIDYQQQQNQQQQQLSNQPASKDRRMSSVSKRKSSIAAGATAAAASPSDEDGVSPFHFPGIYDRDDDSKVSCASVSSVTCHGTDDILKNLIEVTEPYKDRGGLSDRRKKWRFGFDQVFNPQQGQDDVWKATEPLVQSAIDGYNVTIFAFGQTGSGKTYTLLGEPGNEGLIARSIARLFDAKQELMELSRGETTVEISVELLEIYNEQVRDLLAPNGGPNGLELALKVTSNEVIGNERLPVASEAQVAQILGMAQKRRCVKATLSNAESSRSHMLFTIHFHVTTKEGMQRFGKLNICDLAGSERLSKSGANTFVGGDLLKETQHINKSLSTLSNVIERLQEGSPNVPYRESKLTFLLQNSLGGNSKTLAIVCCNPLASHFHESLCSLRFAAKVSKVDLKAVANFSC